MTNDQFVDFQPSDSSSADRQTPDGQCANGQGAKRDRTQGQGTNGLRAGRSRGPGSSASSFVEAGMESIHASLSQCALRTNRS